MRTSEEIKAHIKRVEEEIKRQKEGFYCHFTGKNIAMLNGTICNLEDELRKNENILHENSNIHPL
jgi:ribosomal protein S6